MRILFCSAVLISDWFYLSNMFFIDGSFGCNKLIKDPKTNAVSFCTAFSLRLYSIIVTPPGHFHCYNVSMVINSNVICNTARVLLPHVQQNPVFTRTQRMLRYRIFVTLTSLFNLCPRVPLYHVEKTWIYQDIHY